MEKLVFQLEQIAVIVSPAKAAGATRKTLIATNAKAEKRMRLFPFVFS